MVGKIKSKTKKKGKQVRGTRKSKPLKKGGVRKTNTRVVRPKRVSTRAQGASSRRSRSAESSGQENELLAHENASSISSVDTIVNNNNEQQGEIQLTQADVTLNGATADEPLDIEENIQDQNSGTSERV
jgi:hypothetical protein